MAHFLVGCGEFERDRLVLLDVCRIVGARVLGWILESGRGGKGGIAVGKRDGEYM